MKKILRLNALPNESFRSSSGVRLEDDYGWKRDRLRALSRDDYTCFFCGFRSDKYMEVHHIQGAWYNNECNNLITLCPLCHSCFHIGFAGIKEKGELLILRESCDQAKLNRLILDTVAEYKTQHKEAVSIIRDSLPIENELGSSGLIALANEISERNQIDGFTEINKDSLRYIFFPNIEMYPIADYLSNL